MPTKMWASMRASVWVVDRRIARSPLSSFEGLLDLHQLQIERQSFAGSPPVRLDRSR